MFDSRGQVAAEGTWSLTKAENGWRGTWRAETGDGRVVTGTWSSAIRLQARGRFEELLASALKKLVSGTWRAGGRAGRWSIQTDAAE